MRHTSLPVLVIGAGPAGLAAAAELARRRLPHRLLERGDSLGQSWQRLYDSLVLHTGRHMSALPGLRYRRGTPLFPTRADFLGYLHDYARHHALEVEAHREVQALHRTGDRWVAALGTGEEVVARAVVVASGIIANPRVPVIPGREEFAGCVLHSVEYRRPEGFAGKRVLVVGAGNSGGEIGSELGRGGAKVTMLVRSGANVVPLTIAGIPVQYMASLVRRLPPAAQHIVLAGVQRLSERRHGPPVLPRKPGSPLEAIPLIGFHLVDAIREGIVRLRLGEISRFTREGVVFGDGDAEPFDVVLLATGFTPQLAPLAGLVRTDARGFALRTDRVTSADQPGLYFVGHNYDTSGALTNIRRDAPLVAAAIAERGGLA